LFLTLCPFACLVVLDSGPLFFSCCRRGFVPASLFFFFCLYFYSFLFYFESGLAPAVCIFLAAVAACSFRVATPLFFFLFFLLG
jgi:hypothetical protein